MSAQTKHKKRMRLRKLWRRSPLCYWCGRRTVLLLREGMTMADVPLRTDEATIDHLYSRLDGPRPEVFGLEVTVLACWQCNNERSGWASVIPESVEVAVKKQRLSDAELEFNAIAQGQSEGCAHVAPTTGAAPPLTKKQLRRLQHEQKKRDRLRGGIGEFVPRDYP